MFSCVSFARPVLYYTQVTLDPEYWVLRFTIPREPVKPRELPRNSTTPESVHPFFPGFILTYRYKPGGPSEDDGSRAAGQADLWSTAPNMSGLYSYTHH
jgi:hypothetical protein